MLHNSDISGDGTGPAAAATTTTTTTTTTKVKIIVTLYRSCRGTLHKVKNIT